MNIPLAIPTAVGTLHLLSDPTVLMSLTIIGSMLGSLKGVISWRTTGMIMLLGAAYSQLAQIFDPYAAASIITSSVVSFVFGKMWAELKNAAFRDYNEK